MQPGPSVFHPCSSVAKFPPRHGVIIMAADDKTPSLNFIHQIIEADLQSGKFAGRVATRFPPEPNGYLHIGHAKSICLNFGTARKYGGSCNLRFDDTNPVTEGVEYVESIMQDVNWLGFSFGDRARYASDYFDEMYGLAKELVRAGKAYVDHLSDDEIREYRGSLGEPGRRPPFDLARSRKTWLCSRRCDQAICRTARACSGQRST